MSNERYEVTFCTGPPGHADFVRHRFKTLEEARHCLQTDPENNDPHFRWSKIVDLTTGKQLDGT